MSNLQIALTVVACVAGFGLEFVLTRRFTKDRSLVSFSSHAQGYLLAATAMLTSVPLAISIALMHHFMGGYPQQLWFGLLAGWAVVMIVAIYGPGSGLYRDRD